MTSTDSKKKMKKQYEDAKKKTKKAKTVSIVVFAVWGAYTLYQINAGAPGYEDLMEKMQEFDMGGLKEELPWIIAGMASKFLMFKCLTYVVFTDLLMVSVFDSADDELRASKDGEIDEDKMELLKDWHKVFP